MLVPPLWAAAFIYANRGAATTLQNCHHVDPALPRLKSFELIKEPPLLPMISCRSSVARRPFSQNPRVFNPLRDPAHVPKRFR